MLEPDQIAMLMGTAPLAAGYVVNARETLAPVHGAGGGVRLEPMGDPVKPILRLACRRRSRASVAHRKVDKPLTAGAHLDLHAQRIRCARSGRIGISLGPQCTLEGYARNVRS